MSHRMRCKQREDWGDIQENTTEQSDDLDYRGNLFYTPVFFIWQYLFLAKTLLFQGTMLNSVTGNSLCAPNFPAFKDLSLTENFRIWKKINREEKKETKLKHGE